jgi:HlyD family secretion protein
MCKRIVIGVIACIFFLSAACSSEKHSPGYIEGEYTYIASGVAGTLIKLFVQRGQIVKKGDLLYQLDPEPEKSTVENTRDNIVALESQVTLAKITLERQHQLFVKQVGSKADLDAAQANFDSKTAELSANKALYNHANWALQQKTMHALVDGRVFDTFYQEGEKIPMNQPVLAILAPENIDVLFYIPEQQLSQIKLGETVYFDCDNCKNRTAVTVSYISPEAEFTPPIIYSKDTRNKLVYLIRADIPRDIASQFHPGQPIDVYRSYEK